MDSTVSASARLSIRAAAQHPASERHDPARSERTRDVGEVTAPMLWHRALTSEDVATAHRLVAQHTGDVPDARGRRWCVSGVHGARPALWPCQRARWADEVLAAADRGEVPGV